MEDKLETGETPGSSLGSPGDFFGDPQLQPRRHTLHA